MTAREGPGAEPDHLAARMRAKPATERTGIAASGAGEGDAAAARLRALGVFAPLVAGGEKLPHYEAWLGRRIRFVVDNAEETAGWKEMVDSAAFLARQYAGKPAHPILGIPLLTARGGSSLARGAAGDHDEHFRRIAAEFVRQGLGACTVRLGWEFNGRWMPWFAGENPRAFVQYWRRVVDIFRAASPRFRTDWCPTLGHKNMPTELAWPGPDHVDIIGADVYNEWWQRASRDDFEHRWNKEYLWTEFGLQWQLAFARQHGKTISFPEWGTRPVSANGGRGGGDDPRFIEAMARWFDGAGARLAYQAYFERVDVALSTGLYPASADTFRRLFGGS